MFILKLRFQLKLDILIIQLYTIKGTFGTCVFSLILNNIPGYK